MGKWHFWIDRGGTFTDIVAQTPSGILKTNKLLSENPLLYKDAAIHSIRNFMQLTPDIKIPVSHIASIKMGTTVATNALLERKGDPVCLVTNTGFADSLEIGYQARPLLFAREIKKSNLLYQKAIELNCRINATGAELHTFDKTQARQELQKIYDSGIRSVAIAFMHSYRFPAHEIEAGKIAEFIGFTQISLSHKVSPLIKFVSRGDTAIVDAYLSPLLRRYVLQITDAFDANLNKLNLLFMTSSGGLTSAALFEGRDAILSGPAGGIVGAVKTSALSGFNKIITFDMGGTSTDVAHYSGVMEKAFDTEVAGVRMRVPMMKIHTVASGGGSILHYDGQRFQVGPHSAGADPGPACYGRKGPLSVTDANLVLGRLRAEYFPKIFGESGNKPLNISIASSLFTAIAEAADKPILDVAEGFIKIANQNMANAIKKISVQKGHDISGYALACFGGAAGQHACAVAGLLGIKKIILHPFAGVLSAYGMGLADITSNHQQQVEQILDENLMPYLSEIICHLSSDAKSKLAKQHILPADICIKCVGHLKYKGSDSTIEVVFSEYQKMKSDFESVHREQFGFVIHEMPIIVDFIEIEAAGGSTKIQSQKLGSTQSKTNAKPIGNHPIYFEGNWYDADLFNRSQIAPNQILAGPALILEDIGTIFIQPGWSAKTDDNSCIILECDQVKKDDLLIEEKADPVLLEVFNNLFMSIAEQMGVRLQHTARSVNIKERLDFSCAVFDNKGELIANAPHTPVHLGSMDRSVTSIIEAHPAMRKGDVFVTNAPYNGGTHLPDITVVTPVFNQDEENPIFFVASRGHHADVGGSAPGSMTPKATHIEDEGVILDNLKLVSNGEFLELEIRKILTQNKFPCRNPEQNIADLKAQIAANEKGVLELNYMISQFSYDGVKAYVAHIQDYAETCIRRMIAQLANGKAEIYFDQGCKIAASIRIDEQTQSAIIDFTGTSPQQPDNFNAPEPITRAAVLYCFRCMVDEPIPINAGCLRPITIILPENSMLTPVYPAAVVAGNVEVSQAIADCLFLALNSMANAQGTMNNLNFGNDAVQYYETICGGAGAGNGFDGCDAVHTHMTNTRLTDPEILELRYPVLLALFKIRRQTGGIGKWRGGDGVERHITCLEELDVSILSGRRIVEPIGLNGGGNGSIGENAVLRASGTLEPLDGRVQLVCYPNDTIIIKTPSGGGFGVKDDK
ncbi:hydantoinase B/oxoprolinase family protein [Alphaproteobacteria bacterium]|nr:hydantoinase B/oxoprolinase family protein [Alphaproteobacteria bacterium]